MIQKIFLTSYGGAHSPAVIPLVKELRKRGHHCTYLALTTAKEAAKKAGVTCHTITDFVDPSIPEIKKWGEKLSKKHHTGGKGITRDESIAYLGQSFCDLADELGEQTAWARYEKEGLNAFAPVSFMKRVIKKISPDVVVATTSPRMEKAALRAAHQLNIPSICMIELFGILESPWLSRPDNGDILCVSRPDVITRLSNMGRPLDCFRLTGSPMFEGLDDPALTEAGRAWREERHITPEETVIFWAEQPEPTPGDQNLPRRTREHIASICKKRGWKCVIRLHPSSTNMHGVVLPKGSIQSLPNEPLHPAVAACNALITLTSTVGWEALLMDKPVLIPKTSIYFDKTSFGNQDGALTVEKTEDIESGLDTLLSENSISKKLADYRAALPQSGDSIEKICHIIENECFSLSQKTK